MQNEKIKISDKKKVDTSSEFVMPTRENYATLLSKKYTIKQLKEIALHHKIKLKGISIKTDILARIYNFFKFYDSACTIQKAWRKYLFRQYNQIRGPARFNRSLCVNDTDFFTMDAVRDIPYTQFFSYRDYDKTVYGFDIMSIYNLFDKGIDKTTNPYNRNPFPRLVRKNMLKIIWLSKLFKDPLHLNMGASELSTDQEIEHPIPTLENRTIDIFHDIDILGNYTSASWFLGLQQYQLMRFIIELNDIWAYRAGITDHVKRAICPEFRDLFRMRQVIDIRVAPAIILRELSLGIIEKLVRSGNTRDNRCLGANYVLCALTMVSADAAEALPWLYQSVA